MYVLLLLCYYSYDRSVINFSTLISSRPFPISLDSLISFEEFVMAENDANEDKVSKRYICCTNKDVYTYIYSLTSQSFQDISMYISYMLETKQDQNT